MSQESEKEQLIKLHVNTLVGYLIREKKLSYENAMTMVLESKTYQMLVKSDWYLNQSRLYVLDDFKKEIENDE